MATFLELKTRVLENLTDTPTKVQNNVGRYVNQAIKDLQDEHNYKVMEALASFTTVEGSHSLGSISNFKEFRGRPWVETSDDELTRAIHRMVVSNDRQAVLEAVQSIEEGVPTFLLEAEPTDIAGTRALEIYPASDGASQYSDGEYRIKVPYIKYLADLSADGDTNWFTTHAARFIEFRATTDGFMMDWDEQRAALWEARATREQLLVRRKDKAERLGAVETLIPHWRGELEPNVGH